MNKLSKKAEMFLRSLRMPQAQMGAFTSTAFPYVMQPALNFAQQVAPIKNKADQIIEGLPTDPTNMAPGALLTSGQNLTLTPGVQANATPQVQQEPSNTQQGFDALDAAGLASPVAKIAMGLYNFSKGQQEKAVAKANEKMFKQDYMDRKEKMRDMFYTTPYTVGRSSDFTAQNGRIVLAQDGGMSAFQDFYNSQQAGGAQKLDMFKDVYKQTVDAQNQQAKMLKQQGLGQIAGGVGGIKDMAIQAAKTMAGAPPMQYGGVADWYQGDRTKLDKKQLLQKSLSKIKGNSDYVPFGVERLEDGTEIMYDPYAEYAEVMAKNGYRVVRSSERKGKTHKVIGPDGTVKFFGDSKLGQHPNDPERKKAFYARHAKNLKNNPYFRAFARKTWQEGGMIDYEEEMAKGGLIKRADGSYSRQGLWDNIRNNRGSGKEPTKEMLEQERKIRREMQIGGVTPPTFDQEDMYNFMEQQNQEPTLYDENFNDPELEQVMSQPSVVKQIVANQMSAQPEMEEEMFEYEQPLSTGSYGSGEDLLNSSNVIDRIAYNESRGRYDVVNTQTNTYGKYQFMEKYWADQIKNFMGLPQKTSSREVMETFKNSPESQDKFMNHVVNDIYMPRVVRLRSTARQYGLTDDDVIKLMHYRGVGEAEKMIRNGNFSVSREEQIKYKNPTVAAYLGKPVPGA